MGSREVGTSQARRRVKTDRRVKAADAGMADGAKIRIMMSKSLKQPATWIANECFVRRLGTKAMRCMNQWFKAKDRGLRE